jgi:hypothetical protein
MSDPKPTQPFIYDFVNGEKILDDGCLPFAGKKVDDSRNWNYRNG